MSLESLLNGFVTLQHKLSTLDSSGGPIFTWVNDATYVNIPASIQPLSARDRILYAQHNIKLTHRIYLAVNVSAKNGDRLLVPGTSRVFNLTGFMNAAGRDRVFYLDVQEQAASV